MFFLAKYCILYVVLLVGMVFPAFATEGVQSLMDVYKLALMHDATLASALNANRSAQELIEQGKSLYRPTINLNAEANVIASDIRYLNTTTPPGNSNFENYKYGLDVRQPIFRKQNLVQMDQTVTQVSQADKQLHLSQQNLVLRATQVYFEALITQDKVTLLAAQKSAILSQLEQAQTHFKVGTATITDVNEAQARYDLILAQEIAAINAHQIAQHGIQLITGGMPKKLASVKMDMKTHGPESSMEQWLEIALQNNLNIQIQQEALRLAEQEVERAKAGHLPTLDAVASYTNSYANGSVSVYGTGNELKTGTIGLQLQVPLYQGGVLSSLVRQATLNQQKAQDDVEMARRQATLEIQSAYLNLNTSIAQVKAYEQALTSSQSQMDATQLGYEVGVRTSVDVLNAQQQWFGAQYDLLQARYNYLLNRIRLKSASGIVGEVDLADINQYLVLHGAH